MLQKVFLVSMCFGIAVFFFKLVGEDGIRAYFLLRDDLEETQNILDVTTKKELLLSKEIRLLRSNKEYIIEQVKQKIHYLYPNEIIYTFYRPESSQ